MFEDPEEGQRVRLVGGLKGIITGKTHNFGFPMFEIKLENGKTVTEARYRFDIIPELTPSNNNETAPPLTEELLYLFEDDLVASENSQEAPLPLPDLPERVSMQEAPIPDLSNHNISSNKTTSRRQFVSVDNNIVENFVIEQENKGTARKTLSDMRTLKQFFEHKQENREIYEIPAAELNNLLSLFFYSVRKSDGSEYEPASLRGMMCSYDRVLKRHNYGYEISKNVDFSKTREVIKAKQIELKKMGKGNSSKKAEALSDADIDRMFETGQLGLSSPTSLLQTLWFFNTIYFGLRGVTEHHQMKWGDVKLVKGTSSHSEYLQMNERNTKTRTGVNVKNNREIPQKAWANVNDSSKCPVQAYKIYKSKRPAKYNAEDTPFYIQENTCPGKSVLWYKSQPVGINKLGSFMKRMASNSGILKNQNNNSEDDESSSTTNERRLTNHSARRFMLQKLDDLGYEHNHIKQISGHRNIQSVTQYSKLNDKKHQEMSNSVLNSSSDTFQTCSQISVVEHHESGPTQITSTSRASHGNQQKSSFGVAGGFIFGGPIYGGTFNINIGGNNNENLPPSCPPRKRRRIIIDSDTDSQSQ